jgi:hypothetical protein
MVLVGADDRRGGQSKVGSHSLNAAPVYPAVML